MEGVALADGVGLAEGVGVAEGPGLADGVRLGDGVGLGAVISCVIDERQVTVAPPPFPEPLHWLIVTVRIDVVVEPVETVQRTR